MICLTSFIKIFIFPATTSSTSLFLLLTLTSSKSEIIYHCVCTKWGIKITLNSLENWTNTFYDDFVLIFTHLKWKSKKKKWDRKCTHTHTNRKYIKKTQLTVFFFIALIWFVEKLNLLTCKEGVERQSSWLWWVD